MKKQPTGYIVVFSDSKQFDGYVWPMGLDPDPKAPFNAIVPIDSDRPSVAIFNTPKEARAAINATHYFAKAHYPNHEDERKSLSVVPVFAPVKA